MRSNIANKLKKIQIALPQAEKFLGQRRSNWGQRSSMIRMTRQTQWCNSQPNLPFLSQIINKKQCNLWSIVTPHTKVVQRSSKWLFWSQRAIDSENVHFHGRRAIKISISITKGQKVKLGSKVKNDSRITGKLFPTQTDLWFSFYQEKCTFWPLDDLWPHDRFVWKFSPHQFTSCPKTWNLSDIATGSYCSFIFWCFLTKTV